MRPLAQLLGGRDPQGQEAQRPRTLRQRGNETSSLQWRNETDRNSRNQTVYPLTASAWPVGCAGDSGQRRPQGQARPRVAAPRWELPLGGGCSVLRGLGDRRHGERRGERLTPGGTALRSSVRERFHGGALSLSRSQHCVLDSNPAATAPALGPLHFSCVLDPPVPTSPETRALPGPVAPRLLRGRGVRSGAIPGDPRPCLAVSGSCRAFACRAPEPACPGEAPARP